MAAILITLRHLWPMIVIAAQSYCVRVLFSFFLATVYLYLVLIFHHLLDTHTYSVVREFLIGLLAIGCLVATILCGLATIYLGWGFNLL